jgi:hypothetical protein
MVSVSCVCLSSKTISLENRLLGHLENVFIHPDKRDPQLVFNYENLAMSPNFIITGVYDNFALQIKSLMMENRFLNPKPRILFSRSIDIVHTFHVPSPDSDAPHLSAMSVYDLVVIVFGTVEKNQALAPCMSQVILSRKDERKPTWIYLPENRNTLSACEQEKSADLDKILVEPYFKNIEIKSIVDRTGTPQKTNINAAGFSVGGK